MLLWLSALAFAYETDQLTDRDQPLADARAFANEQMNGILDGVITELNRDHCGDEDAELRAALARAIRREGDHAERVPGRGLWHSFGYGHYGKLLETGPIERRSFYADRSDIYGDMGLTESPVLKIAGTCSTINLGGHLVGVDKIDHFLVVGYDMWRWSDDGERDNRAVQWATLTENTWFGEYTSGGFSYADLRADWDGYRFYRDLLNEGSVVERGADGCMVRERSWDWSDWVNAEWDEVLNPNVYNRGVQRAVSDRLYAKRDELCAEYGRWGDASYQQELQARLATTPEWAGRHAPPRTDPYALAELCAAP